MFDYSGIYYKIFASDLFLLLVCVFIILCEKPWKHKFHPKKCVGIILSLVILFFTILDISNVVQPNVSSYTGEYVTHRRTSKESPPLPFTNEYVFWNGEGFKFVCHLDNFSRDKIFPSKELEVGKEYTVYYDDLTNIIVGIKIAEDSTGE